MCLKSSLLFSSTFFCFREETFGSFCTLHRRAINAERVKKKATRKSSREREREKERKMEWNVLHGQRFFFLANFILFSPFNIVFELSSSVTQKSRKKTHSRFSHIVECALGPYVKNGCPRNCPTDPLSARCRQY